MMKTLVLILVALFIIGCSEETHEGEQRVDVFISMGQSNALGIRTDEITLNGNVIIPIERVAEYPQYINFMPATNRGIDIAEPDYITLINTAVEVSRQYDGARPLYVINIARNGASVDEDKPRGYWSPYRDDYDGKALYPQTLHFLETFFAQLKAEGKDPHVVGFDWNQWESENGRELSYYVDLYSTVFSGIVSTFPNDDYLFFICRPSSNRSNVPMMREVFEQIAATMDNVIIYRPDELVENIFKDDGVHYVAETYTAFAEFMLREMGI
jgi:hypothetical protein